MNNHATMEKMQLLRLSGMLRAFKESCNGVNGDKYTVDEMIAHLIEAEYDERYNKKLSRLLKNASFRYSASFEQISFDPIRKLNRDQILRFSSGDWIQKGESIVITGKTGSGKSYIACALGHKACIQHYSVEYYNCMKLFSQLKYCKADGSYFKVMDKIKKMDLIILDDFGLNTFDSDSRLMLLELIEDRHGRKSMILSSQIPILNWFDCIGNPTIADAICDRLLHTSHKIDVSGPSMRDPKSNNSGRKLPPK
jgi:DNA replication protein DnaC